MLARSAIRTARATGVRSISVGQSIPDVGGLKIVRNGNVEDTTTSALFAGRKVVVFGLPGAWARARCC